MQADASLILFIGNAVDEVIFVAEAVIPGRDGDDALVPVGRRVAPAHTRPFAARREKNHFRAVDLPVGVMGDVADIFPDGFRPGGDKDAMVNRCHSCAL